MSPKLLVTAGVSIIGLLGFAHLLLTFFGPRLLPRDRTLVDAMRKTFPVLTTQTTIWKAWIGFNASHSMGAILFGLVYGYLALAPGALLFQSPFLQVVGFCMLAGFVVLAKLYWFATPLIGSSLALLLYVTGLAMARLA
jgi:hypothetical protein